MEREQKKRRGAYYTPEHVVRSLVKWAARKPSDRLLDPACGDGRFLTPHTNSVGVEEDAEAARRVHERAPGSLIHQGDFFAWASRTQERFECAAGNPPFIRYQRFTGSVRREALSLCARHGARFTALTSSWAPFLVATATLLKRGGRMAFVVPAELGHAPYCRPLIEYLVGNFDDVRVIAVREKLFEELSEDCWLLAASGYGGSTKEISFCIESEFSFTPEPPRASRRVSLADWRSWNFRLRPFVMRREALELYRETLASPLTSRLNELAHVGIGYVTGDNTFFHLSPSHARTLGIPKSFLLPTVRSGRLLDSPSITAEKLKQWRDRDEPNFLLRIKTGDDMPSPVRKYLDSEEGRRAQRTYKCSHREPWYVVPDVRIPDGFLSYMTGSSPALVLNQVGCTGANSVHLVNVASRTPFTEIQRLWSRPFTALSCEIEGHPLGGGMLKLEPREAGHVALSRIPFDSPEETRLIEEGIQTLTRWRHCA